MPVLTSYMTIICAQLHKWVQNEPIYDISCSYVKWRIKGVSDWPNLELGMAEKPGLCTSSKTCPIYTLHDFSTAMVSWGS